MNFNVVALKSFNYFKMANPSMIHNIWRAN